MLKWDVGSEVNLVYVSGSPNAFTCQFFDDIPQLDELMKEIAAYIESQETIVPAKSLTVVGTPLLAKFSEDALWYRAEVCTPEDSDGMVQVLFVDYGNAELVSVANILPIPGQFTKLRRQAATYCLGSTSGTATHEEWLHNASCKFEELALASECLAATVLASRKDCVVVSLKGCLDLAENIL